MNSVMETVCLPDEVFLLIFCSKIYFVPCIPAPGKLQFVQPFGKILCSE